VESIEVTEDGITWGGVPSTSNTTNFLVSSSSSTATAGTSFTVTVTARTSSGGTDTGYTGTVRFTSSDTLAGLPANYTFTAADQGVKSFTVTLKTAGSQSVTVTDTASGSVTGNAGVSVSAAAASTVTVNAPASATAGSGFNVTVTAKDQYGNTATGYRGTVRFTSSDTQATLPTNYTFTASDAGVKSFTVQLRTAGSRSVTVTDTAAGTITGSDTVTVNAAAASAVTVSAPSGATAGSGFTVTVTMTDAYGNTATGYRGTVRFTSSDTQAVLPGNYTFTSGDAGVRTFSNVQLRTAGSRSVTATDTTNSSLTGVDTVTVNAASASTVAVATPASTTAGAAFNVAVTVRDAFGNVATGYRGTVRFTSSDGQAVLPANYTFTASDAGVRTFTGAVTLKTAGTRSVTATDTATSSISGAGSTTVGAATASVLTVSAPANATVGVSFSVTVTARDAYGNTATGYRGTVAFASTDLGAALPLNTAFTAADAGSRTFSVTLNAAGSRSVTVTDTAMGSITGTSGAIAVGTTPVSPPPPAPVPVPPPPPPAPVAEAARPVVVGAPVGSQVVRVLAPGGSTRLALVPHPGFVGGIIAAAGDTTGDGVAEVVTAATFGGHVKVFEGNSSAEIRSFYAFPGYQGPIFLATGDLNGDGVGDLIVAANLNGHVKAFDGATNELFVSFLAYSGYNGSVAVGSADLEGDGTNELLTAADGGVGVHVKALSPGPLVERASFYATGPGAGGFSLSGGDLDGDGSAEFLVSQGALVRVLDGRTRSVRGEFWAFEAGFPGSVSVQAAQYDADASPELVAVAEVLQRSHVKVFDGPAGGLLDSFLAGDR
jgi:hypothetical protein